MDYKALKNKRSHYQLKVKAISLADEAKTIKRLEREARDIARSTNKPMKRNMYYKVHDSLHRHRIDVVRLECRATNVARAFLSGKKFSDVEASLDSFQYYWAGKLYRRTLKIIEKYGSHSKDEDIAEIFKMWVKT